MTLDDRDLRQRFAALRREDEGGTPAFASIRKTLATRRRRPRMTTLLTAAAALAMLLAAVSLLRPPHAGKAPPPPVLSITEWRAPTDFLLQTPGRELLRAVPKIGGGTDSLPPSGRHPKPVNKKPTPTKEESS